MSCCACFQKRRKPKGRSRKNSVVRFQTLSEGSPPILQEVNTEFTSPSADLTDTAVTTVPDGLSEVDEEASWDEQDEDTSVVVGRSAAKTDSFYLSARLFATSLPKRPSFYDLNMAAMREAESDSEEEQNSSILAKLKNLFKPKPKYDTLQKQPSFGAADLTPSPSLPTEEAPEVTKLQTEESLPATQLHVEQALSVPEKEVEQVIPTELLQAPTTLDSKSSPTKNAGVESTTLNASGESENASAVPTEKKDPEKFSLRGSMTRKASFSLRNSLRTSFTNLVVKLPTTEESTENTEKTEKKPETAVEENPSTEFKESFAPDDEKIKHLTKIVAKKEQEAIELRDSVDMWKKLTVGFQDATKMQEAEQHLDNALHGELVASEVQRTVVWRGVNIPTTQATCQVDLKVIIRKGIPSRLRRKVWSIVTGTKEFLKDDPQFYSRILENVYGPTLPTKHFKVPSFGGTLRLKDHMLTKEGKLIAKRVLCTLAVENPELNFCPILPNLVPCLLQYLPEAEVYVCVHLMVQKSSDEPFFFPTNQKTNQQFHLAFKDMLSMQFKNSDIVNVLEAIGVNISELAESWFANLFVGLLHYPIVNRIMDAFLSEGSEVLYRVGLAIFRLFLSDLTSYQSREEFMTKLSDLTKRVNQDSLMKKAFGFQFERETLVQFLKKHEGAKMPIQRTPTIYYRPKIMQPSDIIPNEDFEIIWSFLPDRCSIRDPVRLFYSGVDGCNLHTLLAKSRGIEPTILLLKTAEGNIFGLFVGEELPPDNEATMSLQSFVFILSPYARIAKFGWTSGNPNVLISITAESLTVYGGDGVALFLDKELLVGRSQACSALESEPLNGSEEDFKCVAAEMWTLE